MKVEYFSHEQAGARFGITTKLVGKLISKMKREPSFVENLKKKESFKECKF